MNQMGQLHLTLPSNSSIRYFPENTLANFKTRLHHALDLSHGDWEVGLTEIQYPHNWYDDFKQVGGVIITKKEKKGLVQDIIHREYPVPHRICHKIETLITYLNKLLRNVTFKWDQEGHRVGVELDENMTLYLPQSIAKVLGLPKTISKSTWYTGGDMFGCAVPNLQQGISSMYLYCSLVEPNLVGDTLAPLLRIVPINGQFGENFTRVYDTIIYQPVKKSVVQNVEIDIRDDTGKAIPFARGKVIVSLHLRRVGLANFR